MKQINFDKLAEALPIRTAIAVTKNWNKDRLADWFIKGDGVVKVHRKGWRLYLPVRNLDVSWFANPKYNRDQMEQIYLGLGDKLDVSIYADPKYNAQQMKQIRLSLEKE